MKIPLHVCSLISPSVCWSFFLVLVIFFKFLHIFSFFHVMQTKYLCTFVHSMIFCASLLMDVVILIFFRLCSQLESCNGHSSTWRVPGASTMVLWVLSWVMSCHMLLMIRSAYKNFRNLRAKKITPFKD